MDNRQERGIVSCLSIVLMNQDVGFIRNRENMLGGYGIGVLGFRVECFLLFWYDYRSKFYGFYNISLKKIVFMEFQVL